MPTYEVTIGGKTYDVDAPNEQALPEIVDTISQREGISRKSILPFMQPLVNYINQAPQRAEQNIMNRTSMMTPLYQDPSTLSRLAAHPVGTILRTIAGAGELAEGIPADIAYNLNTPQNIIPDIQKTIMGQRPTQGGDILTKAGAPPLVAAIGGLLAASSKFTPSGALGNMIFTPATKALKFVLNKVGRPIASQAMRFLTGGKVATEFGERALDNPEILSPNYLKAQDTTISKMRQNIIAPLLKDEKAIVPLGDLPTKIENMDILRTSGRIPAVYSDMKTSEAKLIEDIANKITGTEEVGGRMIQGVKQKFTYNDIQSWKNKLDTALGTNWTKEQRLKMTGQDLPSKAFVGIAKQLRFSLDEAAKTTFPETISYWKLAQKSVLDHTAANAFQGINVGFIKSLPLRIALLGAGVPTRGASLLALPLTAPATYKYAIPMGNTIMETLRRNPALLNPLLRQTEENQGE
jgi:hypothetical protein